MPRLDSSISIAGLKIPNRIVIPPIASEKTDNNGAITEKNLDHYKKLAASGAGLIIVEHSFVHPSGRYSKGQIGVHDDAMLEGLEKLAAVFKDAGVVSCIQISHTGSRTKSEVIGRPLWAPSPVTCPQVKDAEVPEAMTKEQIAEIVESFGSAAARAKEAGFDSVEIHGAHGFLLSQFLSPLSNLREDEYGGSDENRSRIHFEVIQEVRKQVGPDYPVFMRLGACDDMEGGLELDCSVRLAPKLVKAGIDMLDVSGGLQGSRPSIKKEGYFSHFAEGIKAVVDIPVMTTGGIKTAKAADELVKGGSADLIGVARTIMANPNWPREALQKILT